MGFTVPALLGTGFANGDVQVRNSAGMVPGIFPSHSQTHDMYDMFSSIFEKTVNDLTLNT